MADSLFNASAELKPVDVYVPVVGFPDISVPKFAILLQIPSNETNISDTAIKSTPGTSEAKKKPINSPKVSPQFL